jgi:hypothetical protein
MASSSSGQEPVAGSCQHDNARLAFMQLAADKMPTLTKLLFGFRFDSYNYRTTTQVGTSFNVPANCVCNTACKSRQRYL